MSLQPRTVDPIPEQTARIARAAFPKGNLYIRMRDEFGTFFTDEQFVDLFPTRGQPAQAPWRLALVTIMQFAEGLSDRQAAEAVRSRIDWKYALSLELEDAGFDSSVLCEFRTRLLTGEAEARLLEGMLALFKERGLLKARGRQRTDSTHVLAAIRVLNRLECIGETLRHALHAVSATAPEWLRSWLPSDWPDRYARRFEEYRLPAERSQRYALAETIGTDGMILLQALYTPEAPAQLSQLPAVQVLRQVWVQQFVWEPERLRWRTAEELPPASLLISSPYDEQARYSKKRHTEWTGYKVHLTETCEEATPNLITDVQTTPATTTDFAMIAPIQANLAHKELLPQQHLVDTGYISAEQLVHSQETHAVDLLGPVADDHSWQARSQDGFDAAQFQVDWSAQTATCPNGRTSVQWMPGQDRHKHPIIHIRFAQKDCRPCPLRACCTQSATQPRMIAVREQATYEALQNARQRQRCPEFQRDYAARAGIEGTISQGVRIADLRRSRYIGLAKTHLHHLLTAAALNLVRVGAWLAEIPKAPTRRSSLAILATG
jgi:transposase